MKRPLTRPHRTMQISGDPFLRLSPRRLRSVKACLSLLAVVFAGSLARGEVPSQLKGHRFLTLNTVVRVKQIEVTRDISHGEDESSVHSPAEARVFREAIEKAWPGARITWAFSWLALHDGRENYRGLRELVAGYHKQFGDEITFIPGAYFSSTSKTTTPSTTASSNPAPASALRRSTSRSAGS